MASKTKTGKKPVGRDRVAFDVLSVAVLTVLSLFCLLPFWLVISGSFSDQTSILTHGYRLIPETFSLDAYQTLFKIPGDLLRAYGVTIFVTATGTFLGLLFTSMAAYVLASSTFRYRYQMSFFFYFTSIFGGGLVPWYIFNTKYLHFHNSVIALILPILINVTYLLILKSYMAGIPEALYESARLDGAGISPSTCGWPCRCARQALPRWACSSPSTTGTTGTTPCSFWTKGAAICIRCSTT